MRHSVCRKDEKYMFGNEYKNVDVSNSSRKASSGLMDEFMMLPGASLLACYVRQGGSVDKTEMVVQDLNSCMDETVGH